MASLMEEVNMFVVKLETDVRGVLENDVAPSVVKNVIAPMATQLVYSKYDNWKAKNPYQRRYTLSNPDYYVWDVAKGSLELTIFNITLGNESQPGEGYDPDVIGDIIESGNGYHWHNSGIYKRKLPRPWMEASGQKAAAPGGDAEGSLVIGLQRLGYDAKVG